MTHSRKFVATLSCCVAASAIFAGLAAARQGFVERFHFEGTFVDETECGIDGLTLDVVAEGRFSAVAHGRDRLVYHLDQFRETVIYANPATGKTVTYVSNGINVKTLKVTDNGDGTLTITTQITGRESLYNDDGESIWRANGLSRFAIIVDHGGTPSDESDDELIADLGQIKRSPPGGSSDACTPFAQALT